MSSFRRENGSTLILGRELDSGGEGKIYTIVGEPHLVAKIYHQPKLEKTAKLYCMLANPPHDPTRQQGHISIAWPTECVLDAQGGCVGFLMPYIDTSKSYPLLKLYNPQDRRKTLPYFTWRYLLRTARNFANVLRALHDEGYVVGDLNESNILVTDTALVTLVDCDSIQVRRKGRVFRCTVGKAEYTPPELQGCDFSQVNRTKYHDNFGLGVLIFLLLMEGRHPFTGVWEGTGTPPTLEQNIRDGNCSYTGSSVLSPPKNALSFDTLPPSLQKLMTRCFRGGYWGARRRPRAHNWYKALVEVEQELTSCSANGQHIYSQHLDRCPWCERTALGMRDPFPPSRNTVQLSPLRNTTRLSPPSNNLGSSVNPTFGCFIPVLLLVVEGALWYMHPGLFNQWVSQASILLKGVFFLSVFVVPFLVSALLSEVVRWMRPSRRTRYANRTVRRRYP